MITNLTNFTKKNILGLIFLILFLNFLTNNLTGSSSGILNQLNIYKLGSFLISSFLYFFIARNINEVLHLNSMSLSISYFFISFFLFEMLLSLMQITPSRRTWGIWDRLFYYLLRPEAQGCKAWHISLT